MKKLFGGFFLLFLFGSCLVQKNALNKKEVARIINTLASDEMQGRQIFTPGAEKAATFIESEFRRIGLQPLSGKQSFRQEFSRHSIEPATVSVTLNGKAINREKVLVVSDKESIRWTNSNNIAVHKIGDGDSFMQRYRAIMELEKPAIIYVDEQFFSAFERLRKYFMNERVVQEMDENNQAVFILGEEPATSYEINFANKIERNPLYNIVGVIPGKSRSNEYVIFSGHYDHIGIITEVAGDSIANGADDDASGITAIISLANHYKNSKDNERTIIFTAFTGEEGGMMGSKHFATEINPAQVVAMFNIEMIGKESKFGKNAAFITGFERSDFGKILQKNSTGTGFTFHPDPYPALNLFNRSDNAPLASVGVPAHTISTVQIDKDKLYHSVDDEVETLDLDNMVATIRAIAASSKSIVNGTDTPQRIVRSLEKP
jgi:hypothetical protein